MTSNLNLYKQRVGLSGNIPRSRQEKNKVATFKNALGRSYNSELVIKEDEPVQALISGIPTHPQIERKNFATLVDHGCEVGDEIFWERDNSHWIITSHDSTERAIFQGFIEKALYSLKWKDPEFGVVYETRACAKGPDQVTISDGVKHSVFYDDHTDSLHLIVSAKTPGVHLLERYFYLMVEGRKWHIEVADRITKENLVILELLEEPVNQHEDTDDLVGGQKEHTFDFYSTLNHLKAISVHETVDIQPRLYRNGGIVNNPTVEISVNGQLHSGESIQFSEVGEVEIEVQYPQYDQEYRFILDIVEDTLEISPVVGPILGSNTALTMLETEYELQLVGMEWKDLNGSWKCDSNYFEKVKVTDDGVLVLKAGSKTGTTEISFEYIETLDDTEKINILKKEIKIIPIFGGGR